MELFSFHFNNQHIQVIGSKITGSEQVLIDGKEVLKTRSFKFSNSYEIHLEEFGLCTLSFQIKMLEGVIEVTLLNNDKTRTLHQQEFSLDPSGFNKVATDSETSIAETSKTDDKTQNQPDGTQDSNHPKTQEKESLSNKLFSAPVIGLILKFSKSFKVVKVLLLGTSAAAYGILFSWQFAIILLAVIIFHEYGHVFAMKRSGLKTKGIYLIPFVGGMAVSERAKSNWQEVYISMMGPVFGLGMSIVFYLLFLFTNNHFIGLVAGFSALINIFNLLPVYPLDGGHVIKAIVFSLKRYWGFVALMALSAAGFALAYVAGWYFINFFIVIGFLDLVFSWRRFSHQNIEPLDKYGMIFSLAWYITTMAIFVGIIFLMINSDLPGTEVISGILAS